MIVDNMCLRYIYLRNKNYLEVLYNAYRQVSRGFGK